MLLLHNYLNLCLSISVDFWLQILILCKSFFNVLLYFERVIFKILLEKLKYSYENDEHDVLKQLR